MNPDVFYKLAIAIDPMTGVRLGIGAAGLGLTAARLAKESRNRRLIRQVARSNALSLGLGAGGVGLGTAALFKD